MALPLALALVGGSFGCRWTAESGECAAVPCCSLEGRRIERIGGFAACVPYANDDVLIRAIEAVTNLKSLGKQVEKIAGEKDVEAVASAWERRMRAEGRTEGIIDTARDLGASDDIITRQLMKKMGWDAAKAAKALQDYDRVRAATASHA